MYVETCYTNLEYSNEQPQNVLQNVWYIMIEVDVCKCCLTI